jgi:hypothetical protein
MNLHDAAGMALAFIMFVIIVGVGSTVLTGVGNTQYTTSVEASCTSALAWAGQANCTTAAFNATKQGVLGTNTLAQQAPTIGTVIGAAVLIGIVLTAFYIGNKQ